MILDILIHVKNFHAKLGVLTDYNVINFFKHHDSTLYKTGLTKYCLVELFCCI